MSSIAKIHTRFKIFDKEMKDIWESYCLVEMMSKEIHSLIKQGRIEPLSMKLLNGAEKTLSANDTYGAISHLERKSQPRATLLEAVAYFEDYLSWLAATVLMDDPKLLKSDIPATEKEEIKLINLILDSADKNEILERIIEEKVRGIFYGNPVEFFTKPKAKLRFQKYFEEHCISELKKYAEITARRNIIVHNNAQVDRKYMREVDNSTFKLNQIVPLPANYLQDSIALLLCLAAKATELILVRHYQTTARGTLAKKISNYKHLPSV